MTDRETREAFEKWYKDEHGILPVRYANGVFAGHYLAHEHNLRWHEWQAAFTAATALERERCAKVCEQLSVQMSRSGASDEWSLSAAAKRCTAAIRAEDKHE